VNEPAQEIRVRVFVRHKATCDYRGEEGYARCRCAKWLRYSRHGKQFRQPANTRSFGTAEEKARELERHLHSGEVVVPSKPDQPKKTTVADKSNVISQKRPCRPSPGLENANPSAALKYSVARTDKFAILETPPQDDSDS
jgi:hypothetical protein